jgi:hypothetical protein
MKKVILRTPIRVRSNFFGRTFSYVLFRMHFFVRTFSDALFKTWTVAPSLGLSSKLRTKSTQPSKPTENQRIFDS